MSSPERMIYAGNCHCGAFKFTVKMPEIKSGVTCNCSICVKKGYLCLTVQDEDVEVLRGEGELAGYVLVEKGWEHEFCKICGTPVWVRKRRERPGGADEFALNIRTLTGIDPFELEEGKKLDALSISPAYVPPSFKAVQALHEHHMQLLLLERDKERRMTARQEQNSSAPGETSASPTIPALIDETKDWKTYFGACHCGAVTLAIQSLPLSEVEVMEDNCSICVRNANTFVYPDRSYVTLSGNANLTSYEFANHVAAHQFCSTCGVHMLVDMRRPSPEVWDKFPEHVKELLEVKLGQRPVRLAVLEGVEWEDLKIVRRSVGTEGYVVA